MISWILSAYKRRKALRSTQNNVNLLSVSEKAELQKGAVETHCQTGDNFYIQKKYDQAIAAFQCALAIEPNLPDAHNKIGLAYLEQKKPEEAMTHLQTAVALAPSNARYQMNIGVLMYNQKNYKGAMHLFKYAASLEPDSPEVLANLGHALQENDQLEEGLKTLKYALSLDKNYDRAYLNLSGALFNAARYDEAVAVMEQALAILPESAKLYIQKCLALYAAGKFDEACAAYLKARQLDPNDEILDWNYAMISLKREDYATGWEKYEARWQLEVIKNSVYGKRYANSPRWQPGDALAGKVIMLFCEQGHGDTLQFIRYATILAKQCAKVMLDCQKELKSLLSSVEGIAEIITFEDPLPHFDLCCSIMSLPLLMQNSIGFKHIPTQVPYLKPNPKLIENWRQKLQSEPRFKVGLVWSGGLGSLDLGMAYIYTFRRRNLKLAQYAPLGDVKGVQFYSLQKGIPAEEAKAAPAELNLIDYTDQFNTFEDTAAFIANLDLVISVDTSVVHLTGAIAKPVWMLNRIAGCYRWQNDREDTPWYPHMRIFHQKKIFEWGEVMAEIAEALKLAVDTSANNKRQQPQPQVELIH